MDRPCPDCRRIFLLSTLRWWGEANKINLHSLLPRVWSVATISLHLSRQRDTTHRMPILFRQGARQGFRVQYPLGMHVAAGGAGCCVLCEVSRLDGVICILKKF